MKKMEAVVLHAPGPAAALRIEQRPVPQPGSGWVLIRVRAFGLNRSELHTRLGLAEGVTFPRVLGIEATGEVVSAPGGEFNPGQQVMTLMGGMGRVFDGGYAEYTMVPAAQVVPFESSLDWSVLGAIPEMLQTANGSLTVGLDVKPGQSILIRGGTSSVGMTAAILAKRRGLTVLSTTRSEKKLHALRSIGVDHPLVDDGEVAAQVREILDDGVDTALELVGTTTLPDTLRATRVHGVVCFTGMLSNEWTIDQFYPIEYLPRGVRLTAYSGGSNDLSAPASAWTCYAPKLPTRWANARRAEDDDPEPKPVELAFPEPPAHHVPAKRRQNQVTCGISDLPKPSGKPSGNDGSLLAHI